ncbi:hypothetical protein FQR65_LT14563 [Abscondita terminalis]|nr:hypothetical protein FQR65_LT14563 [Abscondita terminalis]
MLNTKLPRFSAAVRSAITKSTQSSTKLCEDLYNIPNHVFGCYLNCRTAYCKRKDNNEENVLPLMGSTPVLEEIKKCVDLVARKAHTLTKNVTTNHAERYMSLVAKFVGGKRTNLVQRGSYQRRCYGAGLSFNLGPSWHKKFYTGKISSTFTTFCKEREYKCLYNRNNRKIRRRVKVGGESAEQDKQFEEEKEKILTNLQAENVEELEKQAVGHHVNFSKDVNPTGADTVKDESPNIEKQEIIEEDQILFNNDITITNDEPVFCLICNYHTNYKNNLTDHIVCHRFQCTQCNYKTFDEIAIETHEEKHANAKHLYNEVFNSKDLTFIRNYMNHIPADAGNDNELANSRNQEIGEDNNYNTDIPTIIDAPSSVTHLYSCCVCNYITNSKSNLTFHIVSHCHKCTQCSYKTYDNFSMRTHKKIHSNVKRLYCEVVNCTELTLPRSSQTPADTVDGDELTQMNRCMETCGASPHTLNDVNESHSSKKMKLLEYVDQTEVFPGPELFETSSAKAVVDSDLLKEANEYFATGHSSVKKHYVELKNFTVINSENEEIISSNTATLNNPDTLLDLNTNSDGIEIIPTEDTVVEQIEIQSDYLNVDRECAEEVLDIDKENKNGQEENLDFNNTNKHKKTDHKDLKHPKKTKKRYEPQLLETCKRSCRQNCYERFNDNERKIIFRNYNDLNFREKRLFLDKHIVKNDIKYRKVDANVPRRFSIIYNLPNVKIKSRPENILSDSQSKTNIIIEDVVNVNSLDVEPLLVENFPDSQSETKSMIVVCKSMFMNTLGLRSDSIITDYLKRTINDLPVDLKDKRGQKRAETVRAIAEKNYTDIKNHINSYHPQVSHYNLEHAPNRRYLPCDITIRDMYKDFIEKVYKISYKENIGFASPTQDECGMCSTYKNHAHENAPTNSTSTVCEEPGQTKITICDICKKYDIHKIRYTVARKQYNEDSSKKWTSDFEIFSVDMQKILILPKMTIKNSFFVSRLVVIHETFANLQAGHENKCVLWHEAIRGRNGPDVVSAFYNVLKRLNNHTKHVIFWADNCTAQNKNWTLYTSCVIFVNELWGPDTITFKYFEPGHSFMKADSVHGLIGKKWKHTPEVLDYEDLVHLIESSNKLNKVVNLRVEDFLEFENGCQTRKKGSELPKLNDLKCVQFVKGSKKLFFKSELEQESFSEVLFLKPKFKLNLPKQVATDRGVNQAKKDIIIKELIQHMPPRKQIFWKNLPSREDVEDLGISVAQT